MYYSIIQVKIPIIKKLLKEMMKDGCNAVEFMEDKDTVVFEENIHVTSKNIYEIYCKMI